MTLKEVAGEYQRQTGGPDSRNFNRWLVVVDVMPNVGAIDGFEQIVLPRRTLNVLAKREMTDALELIRDSARELRRMMRDNTFKTSFRFSFSLIDLSAQFAVTTDKVLEWAKFENQYVAEGANRNAVSRDRVRAGAIARNLSGKERPSPVLLDATDPIGVLRNRGMMPLWDAVPQHVPPAGLGVYDDVITPQEYDKAVQQAKKDNKGVWVEGLVVLPGLIEESFERVLADKSKVIIDRMQQQGLSDTNPRYALVPTILERQLAGIRDKVAGEIFRTVVIEQIDYKDKDSLDMITLAKLQTMAFTKLPQYLQPGSSGKGMMALHA